MSLTVHLIGGWSYSPEVMTPFVKTMSGFCRIIAHPFNVDIHHIQSKEEPFILVGWSLGGLRALESMMSGRLKPEGIILISSAARFCANTDYPHGVSRAALRSMTKGIRTDRTKILEHFYRDAAKPALIDNALLTHSIKQSGFFTTESLLDGLEMLNNIDNRNGLSSINTPTLLLHGEQDAIIPRDASTYLHAHLPGSTLQIHPDTGHELLIRQTDWTADRCIDFFKFLMP